MLLQLSANRDKKDDEWKEKNNPFKPPPGTPRQPAQTNPVVVNGSAVEDTPPIQHVAVAQPQQ